MKRTLLFAASALLLAACSGPETTAPPVPGAAIGSFGVDLSVMDTAVKPGDDFYAYVNGKWLSSFEMPADKARYGVFDDLRDKAEADVHAIVLDLAKAAPAAGTTEQKVADFFSSWMDEATIEARGIEPLKPYLEQIRAASTYADLMKLAGSPDFTAPFGVGIDTDPDNTSRYAIWIGQGGLGMPNRDYYLKEGDRFEAYRTAYRTYIETLFGLLGEADPKAAAAAVYALEVKIAETQWAPERQRNVKEAVNPMDMSALKALAPAVDWPVIFSGLGLPSVERVIVGETTAIRDSGELMRKEPLAAWKLYMTFHLANDAASSLPKAFDDASFAFYSGTLRGIEAQRERWKRGVGLLDAHIGEGVGEIYVARHFPPENKAKMDELVANLRTALASRLETLAWMDEPTRAEARRKLATFEPRVGYPSKWRDYSALTVEKGKLFENIRNARMFEWNRQIGRLSEPVDRDEWAMNPQTVNAYYNPLLNQITFPAAILQPPFFDPNADGAVNYGAIGAVIGHEIGHGFDDQGREFDETGKIRNWWTPETNENFLAATGRLAAQFDASCPLSDACVNGRLTMGENIGDLGGLEMAHTAYRLSLKGAEAPVIEGFTGDQRFFMSWAQVWRAAQREDALRNQLLTDPHSPASVRGSQPLRNIDAWYAAFNVQPGDKQYLAPEERVKIW
jgi:endothelin-converting enzyme/putative endopeptidase